FCLRISYFAKVVSTFWGDALVPAHLPILLPAGQAPASKLKRKGRGDRVGSENPGLPVGQVDLRTVTPGIINEGDPERDCGLVEGHAEGERRGVGGSAAIGRPAQA